MELFTVNRYDTNETPTQDPDRERRILEKLQKNIDKKKHKQQKQQKHEAKEAKRLADEAAAAAAAAAALAVEPAPPAPEDDAAATAAVAADAEEAPVTTAEAHKLAADANFQVLGTDRFHNRQHVDAVLPPWLANPTIIANDLAAGATREPVDTLDYLSPNLKSALHAVGIDALFPVQASVIPWIIAVHAKPEPFRPRDLCVSAPTGSGKTLAYAVPIVQVLQHRLQRRIRALVVLPVNELAVQVLKQFRKLCEGTTLTCALLSKTGAFEAEQAQLVEQFEGEWHSRVDIVVATTGRLVEHLHSTPGFCLKSLQFLVMDEADRIMEQIQNNWLYHLDAHADGFLYGRAQPLCVAELENTSTRQPHKLLFSATLSQDPERLQRMQLFQPKLFTAIVKRFEVAGTASANVEQRGEFVGKYTTPAGLQERICRTQAELKPLTLYSLIVENGWKRWLCFTNSGESAHRLSFVLQQLLGAAAKVEELSSGLSPAMRQSVLAKFQLGQINGLVCSDALARGIDVPNVEVVVSYELPRHVKTYVHRAGRTARAGKEGLAVTLLLEHEVQEFENLIKEAGKQPLEELSASREIEETKSKDLASAVEKLRVATERERQIKILKQKGEKEKAQKKNTQLGLIGQLQSQLSPDDDLHRRDDANVPESWKWHNQQNINKRREGKGTTTRQRKQKLRGKEANKPSGDATGQQKKADVEAGAAPPKKAKFTKSK